jgi:glycosyltransferase involved in cell wall biosynthesis
MPAAVALLTPFAFPSLRGNAVTVERIARGLRARGVTLGVWDLSTTPEAPVAAAIEHERPRLIHAFHAWRAGPLALSLARRLEVPLVVTLTGTDANHDLFDPERAAGVRRVLEGASAVVVFHESVGTRVAAVLPDVASRLVVIAQAATLAEEPYDLGARWDLPEARVLFLFAGGIRPVKRPRFPLRPFARLVERRPEARLAYAGPVLDPTEGARLMRELEGVPWARYLGAVPHDAMASLLRASDVVLNCSESEGGMANAILEAFAVGRPVLAADIPGNRSLVEHGVTGLLFSDAGTFLAGAERLVADAAFRGRLGRAGADRVRREYPPAREIDAYLALYRRFVAVPARAAC